MMRQPPESNEQNSTPNIPLFSPLHNESRSDYRVGLPDTLYSFPSHPSTPTRPNLSMNPLMKGMDLPSGLNTPSLRERISPFSFRAEFYNEGTVNQLPKIPVQLNLIDKNKKQQPCNCKVKDCGNQKCNCRKKGLSCLPECKCKLGRCVNGNIEIIANKTSLKESSNPLFEISFKKINDKNSDCLNPSDASLVLYEGLGKRVVMDMKSDTIESASKKIAKRRFSQSLKKFNI